MKKNIVFLAHTNYHLLFSISIIMENFNDKDLYDVTLIHTYESGPPPDLSGLNCTYHILNKQQKNHKLVPETIAYINTIVKSRPDRFFHFNEDEFVGVYMAYTLRKNGTVIGLGQDGLKAYAIIDKPALKYRLLRTVDYYKFLKKNGFKMHPYFFNIKYGRAWSTDELWLSNPEHSLLKNKPSKKVNFLQDAREVEFAKKAFGFVNKNMQTDGVIFIVSSIVKDSPKILKVEKEIIAKLQQKYPGKKIYLKIHPRTPKNILDDILSIDGIEIINDTMAAEFYISELTNSVVIGSYSAGLLYNNPNAKYYWLYPLYAKFIAIFKYTVLVNPTNHIHIVDEIDKIEF